MHLLSPLDIMVLMAKEDMKRKTSLLLLLPGTGAPFERKKTKAYLIASVKKTEKNEKKRKKLY